MEVNIENNIAKTDKENKDRGVLSKEKPYTLKKLKSTHVFTFATIIKKIGFCEIKGLFDNPDVLLLFLNDDSEDEKEGLIEKVGIKVAIEVAGIVISNLESCKGSIYHLLSDLSGMTEEEIDGLDAEIFVEMIMDIFKQEGFRNFFKVVFKFLS